LLTVIAGNVERAPTLWWINHFHAFFYPILNVYNTSHFMEANSLFIFSAWLIWSII
jgi:hypothetical protein